MHIREYQAWLEAWDKARAWDKTLPSHTLLHAIEELGEVSRWVQVIEGYRETEEVPATVRAELALELSDLQVMLFKLAYQCGIDMEEAMQSGQAKADARFPDPATGPPEQAAYWQRFRTYLRHAGLEDPTPNDLLTAPTTDPPDQT